MNNFRTYSVITRQLKEETNKALLKYPKCHDYLFVISWHTDGGNIYGRGCLSDGTVNILQLNTTPGLFGVSSDIETLRMLFPSRKIIDTKIKFTSNNYTPMNLFSKHNPCDGTLVKICCQNFIEVNRLKYEIQKNTTLRTCILIPIYYDPHLQVFMELFWINYKRTQEYQHIKSSYIWINPNLDIMQKGEPKIPMISFDIETVSSQQSRVPTGEDKDDILFSVAIHYADTDTMKSYVYIPINESSRSIRQKLLDNGEYDDSFKLKVFNSERKMLECVLYDLSNDDKIHYLVGYNSKYYDMKYLFARSIFFNLNKTFILDYGITLGWNQIHIDLFHLCKSRYNFKKYSLNYVAMELLNSSKEDVNAVALRNTFDKIKETQEIFRDSTEQLPSIKDMIIYNNQDTKLVTEIMQETKMLEYAKKETDAKSFAINAFNQHSVKMQHKIIMDCFLVGLTEKVFLGSYPSQFVQCLYNGMCCEINTIKNLNHAKKGKGKVAAAYPGGINFCRETIFVRLTYEYDYRIAYPLAIQSLNISPETTAIIQANLFLTIFNEDDPDEWTIWKYKIHSCVDPQHSTLYVYRMIQFGVDIGGRIKSTVEALTALGDSLIIVIWNKRKGVLSKIIETFNNKRESKKTLKKTLNLLVNELNSIRTFMINNDEFGKLYTFYYFHLVSQFYLQLT